MKLVIDIPEKTNAHIRSDYGHEVLALRNEDMGILCYAVYHGTPYEERPHGEWIDVNGDGSIMKCSKCGEKVCCKNNNFCPNCGAVMYEEEW